MSLSIGLELAERGWLPTFLSRIGIRGLLHRRIADFDRSPSEEEMVAKLRNSPVALDTDKANEQHYELPPRFFELVLGPHLKYSSALWPEGVNSLREAEERMLDLTCERSDLKEGQEILELGCGWGSLSLHMARRYPNSRIVAVSNSAPQREFIEARAPDNLSVLTADMTVFSTEERFDRVVSVEMFEHMRNYHELMKRIAAWTKPSGKLFVHVFCHRNRTYEFQSEGTGNWMGRYFFTSGLMPGFELLPRFEEQFELEEKWAVNGVHYQRTAAAWRENMEKEESNILEIFRPVYGSDAMRWYYRWRLFFLACEELFGYDGGEEWHVGHYRFSLK